MDNREAKFILSAYRPAGQDAGDARFADVLDQLRRDPMLEQWFRDSVAFDGDIDIFSAEACRGQNTTRSDDGQAARYHNTH